MPLLESVRSAMEREGLEKGSLVSVAFSGGYDSLALASALSSLGYVVKAVYVDHNIRSRNELDREIELNRKNCALLGVGFEVRTIAEGRVAELASEEGIGTEAAARRLRYDLLSGEAILATAHNLDDQIETVMMRLLSGCTLKSLAGIRRRRGNIVRPLLDVPRTQIESYVDSLSLKPAIDSTNSSLDYYRNRVRHLVVPSLSAEARSLLVRIACNLQDLEARTEHLPVADHGTYLSIDRISFSSASRLARAQCLFSICQSFSSERISSGLLMRLCNALDSGRSLDERSFLFRCAGNEGRFYRPHFWFSVPFNSGSKLPCGLSLVEMMAKDALRIDQARLSPGAFLRLSEDGDEILSCGRKVKVKDILSPSACPYAVVLQDRDGIKAVFGKAFGSVNRIADSMRTELWNTVPGLDVVSG